MMKPALAALLVLVVMASGCTVPGLGTIPIPGMQSAPNYVHDVVVITEFSSMPSDIRAGSTTRAMAHVKNVGSKKVDAAELGENISVRLYDYCKGLFKDGIRITGCPDANIITEGSDQVGCNITRLLPGETQVFEWQLTGTDVKAKTSCKLKAYVQYPFNTSSSYTLHKMSQDEFQKQLREGTFSAKSYTPVMGDGPVKAFFEIQEQQPVISGTSTTAILNIENRGLGHLARGIKNSDIGTSINKDLCKAFQMGISIELVDKKKEIICSIPVTTASPEESEQLTSTIKYAYEYRKESSVSVTPTA
jgi:hypothetical protein